MSGTSARDSRRTTRAGTALRVLGALALGYSGYLHLRIALDRPPLLAEAR